MFRNYGVICQVYVRTFSDDPPFYMTIIKESGYAANESADISVQFTPRNSNYGYNINFNADCYVKKKYNGRFRRMDFAKHVRKHQNNSNE